jgi:hypothetical protein
MSAATLSRKGRMSIVWRPLFALAVLAVLIFGASVYGRLTAAERMVPGLKTALASERYVNIAVVLDFAPEDFHMKYFQALGTLAGVKATTVLIRRVSAAEVRELAGNYWIRRIDLLSE